MTRDDAGPDRLAGQAVLLVEGMDRRPDHAARRRQGVGAAWITSPQRGHLGGDPAIPA